MALCYDAFPSMLKKFNVGVGSHPIPNSVTSLDSLFYS